MSWSYSGDPRESEKDRVRFLIGDTMEEDQLISDEEILSVLEEERNVLRASARAAEAVAGKFSRLADKSIGDYSIKASQMALRYLELAKRLKEESKEKVIYLVRPYAGGISVSDKVNVERDKDRVKPSFRRDMMRYRFDGYINRVKK